MQPTERQRLVRSRRRRRLRRAATSLTVLTAGGVAVGWSLGGATLE